MPKAIYEGIYREIRSRIINGTYAALDDGPKNVPRGSVYGEIADDVRSRCESGDADHEA